jgi:carboxymethylenebutenolidase
MNQLSNVVSRLPEGFAVAVQPVAATTITTGSAGLITGEVSIPSGDIHIPAYRAMPDHGILFPTVLVIHEIFGVHEHIKDLCRRLAKDGYLAIAPYLYAREGDVSNLSNVQELYAKVVSHVPDAQVMKDLDATVNWAGKNGSDTSRLAVVGFCWGGRAVWLYAAHTDAPRAGAAWYGRLIGAPNPLQPKTPVDLAGDLQFPVIGFYGGKDHSIPLEAVEAMRTAIEAADKPAVINVYPEAQHGFNADYRSSYDPDAAKDAWAKMLAFFKEHDV